MTSVPQIPMFYFSRTPHRMRPNLPTHIRITVVQRPPNYPGRDAYRQKARKTQDAIVRISPTNPACPVRFKANSLFKSP